jgi:hypothetical protein
MARTPYTTNTYVGGALPSNLSAAVSSSSTTIIIVNTTSGWNGLGSGGGFSIALDFGNASEEKIYVPAGSYAWGMGPVTLTNVTRGYDGTSAVSHASNASIVHILTATDLKEANTAVVNTIGKVQNAGDLLVGTGANTLTNLPIGPQGTVLYSSGTAVSWESEPAGPQGPQGATGDPGILATNTGTPPADENILWLDEITPAVAPQGPQGYQGTQGTQGAPGYQGSTGNQGTQGVPGNQGPQGLIGYQGSAGNQGSQGFQGATGAQGYQGDIGNQGSQGNQGSSGIDISSMILGYPVSSVPPFEGCVLRLIGGFWTPSG